MSIATGQISPRLHRRFLIAVTFPRTRAKLSERKGQVAWWIAAFPLLLACGILRNHADNVGLPAHGSYLETSLFGSLPTVWLQDHVYTLWPDMFRWTSVVIHGSWFFVPWLAAALVTWKRSDRLGSFFTWWVLLHAIVVPIFVFYPLRPPWMVDSDVTRIIAIEAGRIREDTNQLAAMPSLHFALPMLLTLWFLRERWLAPAIAMSVYASLIGFEVVLSGEHYIVDLIGAAAVAVVIAFAARLDYRRILSRLSLKRVRESVSGRVGQLLPVPVNAAEPRRERGQALMEFALLTPFILIFILILVDFGVAIDRREVLQHAVREGARRGTVAAPVNEIKDRTIAQSQGLLDAADVRVSYFDGPDNNDLAGDAGDNVRVRACFTYEFSVGSGELLSAAGIPVPSIDMNPAADMRLENSVTPPGNDPNCDGSVEVP